MIFLVVFSLLLTVNVALADSPVSTNPSVSAIEDVQYTFDFDDFNYSDADGDDLVKVRIAQINGKGELLRNAGDDGSGDVVQPGDDITKIELENGRFRYTADFNENGANYDSFSFLMFDEADEVSAVTVMNIDVVAVNDGAPTSADNTVGGFEDQEVVFDINDFTFNDVDPEDTLKFVHITNSVDSGTLKLKLGGDTEQIITGAINIGAQLIADGKLVFINDNPLLDENGAPFTSFTFRVNDGTIDSTEEYTMNIDLANVNDRPVVSAIAEQEALENVEFTLTVAGTDVDSDDANLIGASTDSTWLKFEVDSLVLKGTPGKDDLGVQTVNVAIKDEQGAISEQLPFSITVNQGFEIVDDATFKVTVGSTVTNATETAKVAPGDNVTVEFTYKNHLDKSGLEDIFNLIFGNIKINANVLNPLDGDNFVAHSVNKDQLKSGASATESFSFTVPEGNLGDFDVKIDLIGEPIFDAVYTDSVTLSFEVEQKNKAAVMSNAVLVDDSLTCSRVATVKVDVTNIGILNVKPEFWVFDKTATINPDTGVVSATDAKVNTNFKSDVEISPGATTSVEVPVDVSGLSSSSELFVFLSGDFSFDADNKYVIDDEEKVELSSVEDCFNDELKNNFQVPKNFGDIGFDLRDKNEVGEYFFLNADKDSADQLKFEVTAQSNEELVSCEVKADGHTLFCAAPKADTLGSTELTFALTSGVATFEEKVTLNVNPDVGFSFISINGVSESTIRTEGLKVKPNEELDIKFKLKNFESNKAEKLSVSLEDADGEDAFFFTFDEKFTLASLNANTETSLEQLKLKVPLDAVTGSFLVNLDLDAVTEDDEELDDFFEFKLIVEPSLTAVDVAVKLADETVTDVSCNTDVNLNVDFTNSGSVDENDVVILVKDGSETVWNSSTDSPNAVGGKLSVAAGSKNTEVVPVTVKGTAGTHTLDVELQYNFIDNKFADSASASVSIVKKNCLDAFTPTDTTLVIADGQTQEFTVTTNEEIDGNNIQWTVTKVGDATNAVLDSGSGTTFVFVQDVAADYTVTVVVNADEKETNVWTVTVSDKPTDLGAFGFTPTQIEQLNVDAVSDLVLKNANGQITFDSGVTIDLSDIGELSSVVLIQNGLVSVDSENAAVLNKPAKISLSNIPDGVHRILKKDSFGTDGEFEVCELTVCKAPSYVNGVFEFEVDGFSTFKVVIEQTVSPQTSEVSFTDAKFGQAATTTFTLKNLGSIESMTNIALVSNLPAEYTAQLSGVPISLNALGEATVTLTITVPADESAGKHKVGDLSLTFAESETATLIPVFVNPESFLVIETIKVNGKTTGDLKVDEDNEITVKVRNDYTSDMEDVVVTVKILDVDGDDLEEDSDEDEIKVGKSEDSFEVTFDLSGEDLDDDQYDIEVTVVGDAEDGSEHETVETKKNVDLDLNQHEVVLRNVQLARSSVQCLAQTSLDVTVENIGKSNEDDVEIRVSNAALGLNLDKRNIDLDKFSGSDNDLRTSFHLSLVNAAPGTYNIDVEVLRDGKSEDTESVPLTVQECLTQQQASQNQAQLSNAQLAAQLQAQLQAQMAQQTQVVPSNTEPATVSTSFRQSSGYLMLLGGLAVLVFIALILAMVVMLRKR